MLDAVDAAPMGTGWQEDRRARPELPAADTTALANLSASCSVMTAPDPAQADGQP